MSNRLLIGLAFGAVLALGAWLIFPAILSSTSLNISLYIFVSCAVVAFIAATGNKTDTTQQGQQQEETTTLYVGNLPYRANEEAVKSFFASHVLVQSVRLMKDKRTGKRKGYGFIEIVTEDVDAVIDKLNDIAFQDRTLKVRPAKEKVEG